MTSARSPGPQHLQRITHTHPHSHLHSRWRGGQEVFTCQLLSMGSFQDGYVDYIQQLSSVSGYRAPCCLFPSHCESRINVSTIRQNTVKVTQAALAAAVAVCLQITTHRPSHSSSDAVAPSSRRACLRRLEFIRGAITAEARARRSSSGVRMK